MSASIVIGAQWGDEGKGKVVDVLSQQADLVVRFGGGANAGHTIWVDGTKFVLHLIPSGIMHPSCRNVIGGGCVVDVEALLDEMDALALAHVPTTPDRLLLADNAHVVTPFHRAIDKLSGGKIGTTGRGIGPAYADKAKRIGVRLADLRDGTLVDQLRAQRAYHGAMAKALYGADEMPDLDDVADRLRTAGRRLHDHIGDPVPLLVQANRNQLKVLYEGAQGVLLDVDHGTYPFVTSSNTTVAGATSGLGVYTPFERRIAVVKAYTTRVGNGPFPTELTGELDQRLREKGQEFGATTGRPRRCGWLDLVLLKRAFAMNGFTHIALTKLDVLAGFGPIGVAVATADDGSRIYQQFEGFDGDLRQARTLDDLPVACRAYLHFLETELSAKMLMVSTGPGRDDALLAESPW